MQPRNLFITQHFDGGEYKLFIQDMWPELILLSDGTIADVPCFAKSKGGLTVTVTLENGHAVYERQPDQGGLCPVYKRISYSFSLPPATIKDPGHSHQF